MQTLKRIKTEPLTCGVIFYKIVNNKIYLLLIKKNNKYYDIGGIVKNNDYIYSMKSSVLNKTNFLINLDDYNIDDNNLLYIHKFNHMVQFIKADNNICNFSKEDFNNYEIEGVNTIIHRNIVWLDKDKLKIFNKYNLVDKKLFLSEIFIKLNYFYHNHNIINTLQKIKLKIQKNI